MVKIEEKELLERCGYLVDTFKQLNERTSSGITILMMRDIREKIIKLIKSFKNVERILITPTLKVFFHLMKDYKVVYESEPVFEEVYKCGELTITKYLIFKKKIDVCVDNFAKTNYIEIYERN